MQFASFDFADPVLDVDGLRLSVQVVTRSNVFGLDPVSTSVRAEDDGIVVRAAGLRAAGGQLAAPGAVIVRAREIRDGGLRIAVKARASDSDPVRCIKLMFRDLTAPLAWVGEHGERAISSFGGSSPTRTGCRHRRLRPRGDARSACASKIACASIAFRAGHRRIGRSPAAA